MTDQSSTNGAQDLTSLADQLRHLQLTNQELEESIKLQLEFLSIHMNLHEGVQPTLFTPLIVQKMHQQHLSIHGYNSKSLLAKQIHIQQEREMNQLVKNYQGRIEELSNILRSKEAEIAEATEDQGSNNLPRRENVRKFNIQCIQKNSIHKALQELKRLNVQNDALKHCLKQKSAQKKLANKKKNSSIQPKGMPIGQSFKEKIQNMPQDKLISKVYELLQEEVAKENRLKSQVTALKDDWERMNKVHRQLAKKYKHNGIEQGSLNNRQHYCEDAERGLNFLEELERAEAQPIKENALFNRVDMNIEKQKGKSERRKISSQDRNGPLKEN